MPASLRLLVLALLALLAVPASAEDREVPYWASIRSDPVNMRVGPAKSYPIAWVFHRKQLPVKVVRLMEGWRLVEDPSGERGWILARFLSPEHTALVVGKGPVDMRERGDAAAPLKWRLAPGVVGKLGDCEEGWCLLEVGKRRGFVPESVSAASAGGGIAAPLCQPLRGCHLPQRGRIQVSETKLRATKLRAWRGSP